LDPKPISVDDFWKLHQAATDAGDQTFAAMMSMAVNMAAYAGEAAALRWEEVDLARGELVTRRPKTGVSRVARLCPEVIKALKELPRTGAFIFNTRVRSYTVFSALESWRKYRDQVGLSGDVVFEGIRDLSFTVACRRSLDQARVLAGHRLPGMSDNYVRRDPSFVTEACDAIHDHLFVRGTKSKSNATKKASKAKAA
jgi:integrase